MFNIFNLFKKEPEIEWFKKKEHVHEFEDVKYELGGTTCECGAWQIFHYDDSPSGNCGNFRPMTGMKKVCKTCGYEEEDKAYLHTKIRSQIGI